MDLLYFRRGPSIPAGLEDAGRRRRSDEITRREAFRPEESPDGKLVYYGKFGKHGLWSIPVSGGEERQILDSTIATNWTVTSKGIYYLDFAVEPDAPKLVKF